MKTHGFGIIGCGVISEYHAAAIKEIPNARLVAAAEPVKERLEAFMRKHQCEGTTDYEQLARREDVDVVCVCTPSGAHLEPGIAVAKAGKHVVVEKPIEVTLKRADALISACNENGVRLCGIFPSRLSESAMTLKKAVEQGRFGRITVGDAYNKWWRSQEYYDSGAWRGTKKLDGGGACMNQGIHAIDLIQWFMGPVETVAAFTGCLAHERIEVEDTAVAAVRYESGAMGVIECTTSIYPGMARRIEIHGDKGTVVMEDDFFTQWQFAEERPEDEEIRRRLAPDQGHANAGAADPRTITHENHREQLRDFLKALETGGNPMVDGREGRKALEIITAIYRSAETGKPVRLPLVK